METIKLFGNNCMKFVNKNSVLSLCQCNSGGNSNLIFHPKGIRNILFLSQMRMSVAWEKIQFTILNGKMVL